jgi:hypothetical protein
VTETDDFGKCMIWHTTHNYYNQEGTVPATANLLVKPKDSIDLRKFLKPEKNCSEPWF